MQKLLEGLVKFRRKDFAKYECLFGNLKRSQKPHTLFIGCSDSRLVPNLITKTLPGELFVIRNVANIIPPYRETEEYLATTSAIEYAVNVLEVENIVVCGHSNCGGCSSIFLPEEDFKLMPHTRKWLELARNVKETVLRDYPDEEVEAREWITEQLNVIEQIKHLLTYPFIKEKYLNHKLNISGWYYIIETGEVFIYNKDNGEFVLVN